MIGHGLLRAKSFLPDTPGSGNGTCIMAFTVSAVPKASFYSISVKEIQSPTYAYADLQASGWTVILGR